MSITFTDGANPVTVRNPSYGYVSTIAMPLDYSPLLGDGSYGIFDQGGGNDTYDVRKCACQIIVDATDINSLNALLSDQSKGRGEEIDLELGGSSSGFFPFGPDFGDIGTFQVNVMNYTQTGILFSPFRQFKVDLELLYKSGPTPGYSITDNMDDGSIQIGTITGVRFPQGSWQPFTEYAIKNFNTHSSTAYNTDMSTTADRYETEAEFTGNKGKMGALVDHLVTTVRDNNLTLIAPSNNYAFGRDKGAADTYTVQPLTPTLTITHLRMDNMSVPLRFRWVS